MTILDKMVDKSTRNLELRETTEPTLAKLKGFFKSRTFDIIAIVYGKEIKLGTIEVKTNNPPDKEAIAVISHVFIQEEYQRQGYGFETYVRIIKKMLEEGFVVRNDNSATIGVKKIWEKLNQLYIADMISPFEKITTPEGESYFSGHYEIKPK